MNVAFRPAAARDLDFLTDLYAEEDVRPFLAGGAYDRNGIAGRLGQDPDGGGLLVVELDADGSPTLRPGCCSTT